MAGRSLSHTHFAAFFLQCSEDIMATGSTSKKAKTGESTQDKTSELEATIASLTKQNSKLKNELKFTTETERWVGLVVLTMYGELCLHRRTSGEYIASLQRDLETLQSRNEQVSCFDHEVAKTSSAQAMY